MKRINEQIIKRGCAQQEDFVILEEFPSIDVTNFVSFYAFGVHFWTISMVVPKILAFARTDPGGSPSTPRSNFYFLVIIYIIFEIGPPSKILGPHSSQ